jgi:hypothetical protein
MTHRARRDSFKIRLGTWFEASASGRVGIGVVAALWATLLAARVLGVF